MTKEPLVSIIIPTFNRAHLIGETLDSVLAQTYQNWECIVVDDGSMDGTDQLMASYCVKDSRFQYHHRPADRLPGGNAARNYGFEVCKGEYVNFLDSDDYFDTKAIEVKIYYALRESADVIISMHARSYEELTPTVNFIRSFETNNFDIDFVLSRNSIVTADPLIKTTKLTTVRFDEELVRFQDYDFFIRLFRTHLKYCMLDAKLYCYRENNVDSISSKALNGVANKSNLQLYIVKQNLEYYKGNKVVELECYRTIRKMYKSFMKERKIMCILKNYNFYRKGYILNFIEFSFYFFYNLFFQKGFDKMKRKIR
ncbi:glycosyltransferase family 2 protein [Winogradskyella vidalii]|uniref:glycosyltransferase family 2 protein n=1 Tax=Winogradskyella vidalii TaxID=2615024 RepID=UPI0015CAE4EC|nr:glycosyltransferase family 2 protein [Winogradskyella vidalii]